MLKIIELNDKCDLNFASKRSNSQKEYFHDRKDLFCETHKKYHVSTTHFKLNQKGMEGSNKNGRFYVLRLEVEAYGSHCGVC
jgi:hypothetical protein